MGDGKISRGVKQGAAAALVVAGVSTPIAIYNTRQMQNEPVYHNHDADNQHLGGFYKAVAEGRNEQDAISASGMSKGTLMNVLLYGPANEHLPQPADAPNGEEYKYQPPQRGLQVIPVEGEGNLVRYMNNKGDIAFYKDVTVFEGKYKLSEGNRAVALIGSGMAPEELFKEAEARSAEQQKTPQADNGKTPDGKPSPMTR